VDTASSTVNSQTLETLPPPSQVPSLPYIPPPPYTSAPAPPTFNLPVHHPFHNQQYPWWLVYIIEVAIKKCGIDNIKFKLAILEHKVIDLTNEEVIDLMNEEDDNVHIYIRKIASYPGLVRKVQIYYTQMTQFHYQNNSSLSLEGKKVSLV
jgi:hypothetical protein